MKAEYLLDLYYNVLNQHSGNKITERLARILSLSSSDERYLQSNEKIRQEITDLESILGGLNYQSHTLYVAAEFKNDTIFRYLGRNLAEKLLTTYHDHSNERYTFRSSIENLKLKYDGAISEIVSVIVGMSSIGIEPLSAPDAAVQIVISFPQTAHKHSVDYIRRELSRVSDLIALYEEISSGTRGDVILDGLSASRVTAFLTVSATVATMLSATISFSLDSVLKLQEISKNHSELSHILSGSEEDFREAALKQLATNCADKVFKDVEAGLHESAMKRQKACYETIKMLDDGYSFAFRSKLLETQSVEQSSDGTPSEKKDRLQVTQLRDKIDIIVRLERNRKPRQQPLLEGPSK